ncbi:tRNA (guanosine(46)-N7)-methyltransferase TrmB, partial [Listeria monocytogenes]|nr:tRNA (guanosine(46)-N7)-methyltransferase TrmB [Listeria monocytogenes]
NSDYEGNIKTEYEEKFSAKGFPIYRLEAKFDRN